jgi:tetratricopeptide (TPR) repeat protein
MDQCSARRGPGQFFPAGGGRRARTGSLLLCLAAIPVLAACAAPAEPLSAEAYRDEGRRLLELAQWDEANQWMEEARRQYPGDLDLVLLEFDLWFAQHRYRRALQGIDAARAVHGDVAEIVGRRIEALRQLRRFAEVLAILDAGAPEGAGGESREDRDRLYERGEILAEMGRSEEAFAAFRRVLDQDPANWRATVACAALALDSGDEEELAAARALLAEAPESVAAYPDVLMARAQVAERLGLEQEAEDAYRAILAPYPRHLEALMNCGLLLERTGRLRQAAEFLEEARGLVAGRDPVLERRLQQRLEEIATKEAAPLESGE